MILKLGGGFILNFKKITQHPNTIITVFTKTGLSVCGCIPMECTEPEIQLITSKLKDGTLLHVKVKHEKSNL